MAITRRNYTPGQYETFTNEPVGTPVLNTWYPFQLDGLFSFDVADDVILYQGGSPIPSSAYDLSTDATYTAREASFSGLTLVKQFRITNATYAGIATVASGKNFGSAVDNDLLYIIYQSTFNVGDFKYTATDEESTVWKNLSYTRLSQGTNYTLWNLIGHGYAKNSTDAGTAEAAGQFHIPDGGFLFPRAGVYSYNISDTAIDTSTDRITITAHGMATDGTANGRPIKLMRFPGQSPTMPVAITGYAEYNQNYIRVIDVDTIELYDSEAHAVDTSGTTGRANWSSAGSGTFKLTTAGCYQTDQMQRVTGGGVLSYTNLATGALRRVTLSTYKTGGTDPLYDTEFDSSLSPDARTGNETRPSNVSLNMQIKVI
jgi:hypothetical protein